MRRFFWAPKTRGATIHWKLGASRYTQFGSVRDTVSLIFGSNWFHINPLFFPNSAIWIRKFGKFAFKQSCGLEWSRVFPNGTDVYISTDCWHTASVTTILIWLSHYLDPGVLYPLSNGLSDMICLYVLTDNLAPKVQYLSLSSGCIKDEYQT